MIKLPETISEIFANLNTYGAVLGLNFLSEDFKSWNLRLFSVILFMIGYLFVSIYCFKLYADDFSKLVFCGVTFGFLIKATVQLTLFLSARAKLRQLVAYVEDIFNFASKLSRKSNCILMKFCSYLNIMNKLTKVMCVSAGISTMMYPIASKLFFDELILPYGFELPFFDPFTVTGYCLNYIYSSICCILCVIGFTIGDSYLVTLVFPIYGAYASLTVNLDSLKFLNDTTCATVKRKREECFDNIVKLHQDSLNYIIEVSNFLKISNFCCINTITSQCVASLFALITKRWYIGASLVILNLFQLLIFCILGEVLVIMQEKFYTKLNEIEWFDKSRKEKRTIMFIMSRCQEITNLSYVLGRLNLATFMTVRAFQAKQMKIHQ